MRESASEEQVPYERLTFSESRTDSSQIYKGVFWTSFSCFGNQNVQLATFNERFVKQYNWISETQFRQIVDLCWSLPGPTTIQFIVTMSSLKLRSPLSGFFAFLIFNLPAWFFLFVFGQVSRFVTEGEFFEATQVKLIYLGCNVASAGIVLRSCAQSFKLHHESVAKLLIIIGSGIVVFLYRSINSITFCLAVAAILSLYLQIESKKKLSHKSSQLLASINWKYSKQSLVFLIFLYTVMGVWFGMHPESHFKYIFVFYFVGCFLIGPATTVFIYFMINFLQMGYINQERLLLGAPIAFLCPGTPVNIGIYFGSIIDGIRGVIFAVIFLYLPCFVSLLGILPEWTYYRKKAGIQRINAGISCAAAGFCLAYIAIVLQKCFNIDDSNTVCLFIISAVLNYVHAFYTCLIVCLCAVLANCRRWGLIYYRFLPDRSY